MNAGALFIIDSDPRVSGRPAEAVRIAAGVSVWKRVDVLVYLRGAAVLILAEETDELAEQDSYSRYLPVLGESGRPIYVQRESFALGRLGRSALPFEQLSDAALARLAADHAQVIRF